MNDPSNEPAIRAAFEAALIQGLKGEPLTNKDGDLVTTPDGETILATPEASFLSVCRAYLKDLMGGGEHGNAKPQVGKPREGGLLDQFMQTKGKDLPFGRPQ